MQGRAAAHVTSEPLLKRGLGLLKMLTEDFESVGADSRHPLQRAWELQHRSLTAESVAA